MLKTRFFALFILSLIPTLTFAQGLFTVNGATNPFGSCVSLTNASSTATATWVETGLTLATLPSVSFSQDFEVFLGFDDQGGDGLAIVIHQSGTNTLGEGGYALGYGGIAPSVALEVDTSPQIHDSLTGNEDHLAIHVNGDYIGEPVGKNAVAIPNIEDGLYHKLTLRIRPEVTPGFTTVTMIVDDKDSVSATMDATSIFDPNIPIILGITSGNNLLIQNDMQVSFGAPGTPGTCGTSPLPVLWKQVRGRLLANGAVGLSWSYEDPLGNTTFQIQRRKVQQDWEIVATQGEAAGTFFADPVPVGGLYQYRIVAIDLNGDTYTSSVVEVFVPHSPVNWLYDAENQMLHIQISPDFSQRSPVQVEIMGLSGKQWITAQIDPQESSYSLSLDQSQARFAIIRLKNQQGEIRYGKLYLARP
ncbi:MAG: hypothetical protein AAFR59_06645 [Bacteroidota bacterium]